MTKLTNKKVKKIRKFMLVVLFFVSSMYVVRAEKSSKIIFDIELPGEQELVEFTELLEQYAVLREQEFYCDNSNEISEQLKNIVVSGSAVFDDEIRRIEALQKNLLYDIQLEFVENTFTVLAAEQIDNLELIKDEIVCEMSADKEYIELEIYEWTKLGYTYDASGIMAEMGFETRHYMIIENTGLSLKIVSDRYEERTISGIVTQEYKDKNSEINMISTACEIQQCVLPKWNSVLNGLEKLRNLKNGGKLARISNVNSVYDVASAIDYAERWTDNSGNSSTASYNPYYYYYGSNDCCNFVSQCLRAGGLTFGGTWECDLNVGGVLTRDTNYAYSGEAWRSTSAFASYWSSVYGTTAKVKVTTANVKNVVYPGNPMYIEFYKSDGSIGRHVGICTGYVGDMPVLNAHTNNRVGSRALGWLNSDGFIAAYTIQINTSTTYEPNEEAWQNGYINAGTVTSRYTHTGTLAEGETEYFYFTVSSTRFYDMYTTGNMDTYGELYVVSNETLYPWFTNTLHLGDYDDDNGNGGKNFWLYDYLETGVTYCVKIESYGDDTSYTLIIE